MDLCHDLWLILKQKLGLLTKSRFKMVKIRQKHKSAAQNKYVYHQH